MDKGSVLIRHANHSTAHSHWRALWSTDPSQVQKVIHQRRIVNWIPEKKKFLQTLPKSHWRFPMAESSAQQLSLSRLIFTTAVGLGSVCLCVLCVLSRMLFRSSLWREHKMSSVNPHSERNAMATPTVRQMHAREADIKRVCVCVSSIVNVKAKSRGPNKRKSKRNQPINTTDYLQCMQASTKAWKKHSSFVHAFLINPQM